MSFNEDVNEKRKSDIAIEEEKVLRFWQEREIFRKTLERPASEGNFVFYDGPPFATGLPHYGHILAGTIKDVIPRYQTMCGKYVRRVWGWDCHGLPVENLVEKELGLKSKKDIEDYGIEEFNRAARESVLLYDKEWKRIIPRMGRWVDMDNAYKTMNPSFTESVFHSFKMLNEKGLLYKGFKSMHICPRCETTLSNFEVNLGYKDIKDNSVTAMFKLRDPDTEKLGIKKKKNVYVLSWTTTPWTLPGNAALAVGGEIRYVLVEKEEAYYILAEDRLSKVIGEDAKTEASMKGKDLEGLAYEPLFDFFIDSDLHGDKEKGWKIYSADFVTTEEGTGVVHIAPAFGYDDHELSKEHDIPFIQHVNMRGEFTKELGDLAGRQVKPEGDCSETDIEIIKRLAREGKLFSKEKITHSYPHCWRCETPLLNYATDSWFVKVSDLVGKLVEENKKVLWIPEHVGSNRFGEWLAEAKDWSVSRSRFWGTPIPIWECHDCGEYTVVGSFEEIAKQSNNVYFAVRHGEAESNVKDILSSGPENPHHLTEKGKKQVKKTANTISSDPPDVIVTSDILRAKETAEIIADVCGISSEHIVEDARLRELDFGDLNLRPADEYRGLFDDWTDTFENRIPGGESYVDVKRRLGALMDELEMKYSGKRILIVSHNAPLWLLSCVAVFADRKESIEIRGDKKKDFMDNAEVREITYKRLPHNENYEKDMHRPYIDEVELNCSCGGVMKRISDVFDTWYDSGSVPFAQIHYPFENKKEFEKADSPYFPADFIAEGQDQTRGWFYTLLVLSTALFGRSPFKTVVVNGIVLAEDGKKMSKRLKNYPDPMDIVDRYGADALRYSMLSSQVVRAEDLAFSEGRADEVAKKLINRLMNVVAFYRMYASEDTPHIAIKGKKKKDLERFEKLDKWIEARLMEVVEQVTKGLDAYEINQAARPLMDFVDDLSTWYIRRSRERFKNEGEDSKKCLFVIRTVLKTYSQLLAPFMPFTAERVYGAVRSNEDPESVHLASWPEKEEYDRSVMDDFRKVRKIISIALERRSEAGVRVRQPLSKVVLKRGPEYLIEDDELIEHIRSEVNVKEVVFKDGMKSDIELDLDLTPDLIKEGEIRDLVRILQSCRKKEGFTSQEKAKLSVETDESGKELLDNASDELRETVKVTDIVHKVAGKFHEFSVNEKKFRVGLEKDE